MNEKLTNIFDDPIRMSIGVGIASFVVGVGVGFGLNHILNKKKQLVVHKLPEPLQYDEQEFEEFLDKKEKELGISLRPARFETDKEEVVIAGKEFVEEKLEVEEEVVVTLVPDEDTEEEDGVIAHNVFAETTDEWNYKEEIMSRSSSAPYVLHKDEFYADELQYSQHTLTYFAGDNIMVDEDEKPVYNHDQITGELKFGHGSDDVNVVYIRNDRLKAEYEVIRDSGLYSVEILGLDIEDNQRVKDLKHSHHVPRFHMD